MKKNKCLFLSLSLSLILMLSLSLMTVVKARDISPLACEGCGGGGYEPGYYTKTTAVSHSPVASSTFTSKVYISGASFSLVDWSIRSEMVMNTKKAVGSNFQVTFTYEGFDSNYAIYSGTHNHYY